MSNLTWTLCKVAFVWCVFIAAFVVLKGATSIEGIGINTEAFGRGSNAASSFVAEESKGLGIGTRLLIALAILAPPIGLAAHHFWTRR